MNIDDTLPTETTATPEAADSPEAPKRKRAPRKKALAAPDDGAQGPGDDAVAAEPDVASQRTEPPVEPAHVQSPIEAQRSESPVEQQRAELPVETRQAEPAASSASEGSQQIDAAAPADPSPDAAPAALGDAPRRSRNRRRGRRPGERPDRGDDAAATPVDGDGTDAAAAPVVLALPPADVGEVFAQVLSGLYDAEPAPDDAAVAPPVELPKRVLSAEPDAPKLHKVLAQAGVGSRRDMEQMIVEGRITVNGEPAHIGQRISFGDRIAIGGKPVRFRIAPPPPRVLAYHKPAGEVVSHDDPQQRPTVFRRLPRLQQGKWQSVGRLDINTEGLLLFTNSGELANQLMHPRFGVEREYAVRSLGTLDDAARARLLEGVDIDGQHCAFRSIDDGGGEGANRWYRCVITEGRNREVRRLFESVGHAVSRLIRIRYGSVVLPKGLKRGVWVDLSEQDVRQLRRAGADTGGARGADDNNGRADGNGGNNGRRNRRDGGPGNPPRGPREPRPPRPDAVEGSGGAIPNPLQQTYDRRAIQQERRQRRDIPEDGPIPNPLQQTYDKRALQQHNRQPPRDLGDDGPIPNPLQQTYDKRFAQPARGGPGPNANRGAGNGANNRRRAGGGGGAGGERQPDPMQTSVGYIGGDAFLRRAAGGGNRGRGGGGNRGGGGGGNRGGGGNNGRR